MPKGQQQQVVAGQGQRIVQAGPGKNIPQGATIVKLVNAQGQPGEENYQFTFDLYFYSVYILSTCPSLFSNEPFFFSVETVSDSNSSLEKGLNY